METVKLCSGFGRYHTNEPDEKKPKKRLTPYSAVAWEDIIPTLKDPPTVDKTQAQWLIPSTVLSRSIAAQRAEGRFALLWADLDKNPPGFDAIASILVASGIDTFELYSSRSATTENQKCRLVIPLPDLLDAESWRIQQKALNNLLDLSGIVPDRANENANQIFFLPNRGKFYAHAFQTSGDKLRYTNRPKGEL